MQESISYMARYGLLPGHNEQTKGDQQDRVGDAAARDERNALAIDRLARILFPLSWLVFTIIYFFYFVQLHRDLDQVVDRKWF